MSALVSRTLLATPLLTVRDVQCSACRGRHSGAAECDPISHIVIPHRGNFVRRVGMKTAHADVNQALFFKADEEYRIDHITDEGDACLSFDVSEPALAELSGAEEFRASQRRIEPGLQLLMARLRHGPCHHLRAEEIAVRIARRLDGGQTWRLYAEYFARLLETITPAIPTSAAGSRTASARCRSGCST